VEAIVVLVTVFVVERTDGVKLVVIVVLFSVFGMEVVFETAAPHPVNRLENKMIAHKPDNKIFFILFVPKEVLKTETKSTIAEICKVNIIGL